MDDFCLIAKAIGDPSRLRLLKMLEAGELCVCHLTARVGLAQSTVSKQLALLRQAGLVTVRRQGLWAYYRLAEPAPGSAAAPFALLVRQSLNDDPAVMDDRQALTETCCPAVGEAV